MIHKPKKSLGQNFLKSQIALSKMCEVGEVHEGDCVLEIGPGKGALTEKLLEKGARVLAIEKDRELIGFLEEKFSKEIKSKNLILINDDILQLQITNYQLLKNYKIIANIPYNITGAILKKFLDEKNQPESMTLLVQKEVAERIVGRNDKESILSLCVKVYGNPKYIMKVSKNNFSPKPKVDSAIITIKDISRKNFKDEKEEKLFLEIIKSAFSYKRKTIWNNLNNMSQNSKNIFEASGGIEKILSEFNISKNARSEDISIDKWILIIKKLDIN